MGLGQLWDVWSNKHPVKATGAVIAVAGGVSVVLLSQLDNTPYIPSDNARSAIADGDYTIAAVSSGQNLTHRQVAEEKAKSIIKRRALNADFSGAFWLLGEDEYGAMNSYYVLADDDTNRGNVDDDEVIFTQLSSFSTPYLSAMAHDAQEALSPQDSTARPSNLSYRFVIVAEKPNTTRIDRVEDFTFTVPGVDLDIQIDATTGTEVYVVGHPDSGEYYTGFQFISVPGIVGSTGPVASRLEKPSP